MGMYWCMKLENSRAEPAFRCWIRRASMYIFRMLFLSLSVLFFCFATWAGFLHFVAFEFEGTDCKSLNELQRSDSILVNYHSLCPRTGLDAPL